MAKNRLHAAAEAGEVDVVKSLLKKKWDPNELDDKHWTPLHCAANSRKLDVCRVLLKNGADPRAVTSNNATALHYLCRMKDESNLVSVLKQLVDRGADVNHGNYQGNTPLHEAALRGSTKSVQFLLENRAKLDSVNAFGETPVHNAMRSGNMELIEMLVKAGARVDLAGKEGTALSVAERALEPDQQMQVQKMVDEASSRNTRVASPIPRRGNDAPYDFASLPEDLKLYLKNADITPSMVDQNWEAFTNVVRYVTGDKYLPPSQEDPSPYSEGDPRSLYKLIESAGKGGYGRVYWAKEIKTKKMVAIKKLENKTDKEMERNLNEIIIMKKCQCQSVVTFLDAYYLPDIQEVWIVMEYMDGGSLYKVITKSGLTERQIAYVAKGIVEGLIALHSKYVVHRDIKSHNVMLTMQGDVKFVDFGLSLDLSKGGRLHTVGSPFWMAPEIINRQPHSLAIDIWNLGIVLLEMANGGPPNRDQNSKNADFGPIQAMFMVATGHVPELDDPSKWSGDMAHFISECLKPSATDRPSAQLLIKHRWLRTACSRDNMKEVLARVFLKGEIETMGFGI